MTGVPVRSTPAGEKCVTKDTMKAIILLITLVFVFYSMNVSYASMDESLNPGEKLMLEGPFLQIYEKVIVFLKNNPDKNNLSLKELLKEGVINKDDYDFIIKNKIKYNPPSSAGPNDNFLSIFDRDNEDCTSSHILYSLVDKSDPSITKKGDINSLNKCLKEWYDSKSNKKSVSVFNNEDFYYFMICYYNNEHWDRQHVMLIDFSETDKENINKFRRLINVNEMKYREYVAQARLHIDVMLPSNLSVINQLCAKILEKIFLVSPNDVINFTADGFRFNNG